MATDPEKGVEPNKPSSTSRSSRDGSTTTDVNPPSKKHSGEGEKDAIESPAAGKTSAEQKRPSSKQDLDLKKVDTRLVDKKEDNPDDIYAHLPPHEAEILKRQVVTPDVKAGIAALYRYSSTADLAIMAVSALAAIASGAALPLMTVLFGSLQGTFQDYFTPGTGMTYDDFMDEIVKLILYFVYLAIGEFVSYLLARLNCLISHRAFASRINSRLNLSSFALLSHPTRPWECQDSMLIQIMFR